MSYGLVSAVATGLVATAAVTSAAATTTATAFTAAAATTIAAATTATATLKRATAAAATTAAAAFFTRTCDIDGQGPAFKGLAVELFDGAVCFGFRAHRHECKSTALACEFVLHQEYIANGACLPEEILQIGFCYVKGKVPHVKFVVHTNNCQALR